MRAKPSGPDGSRPASEGDEERKPNGMPAYASMTVGVLALFFFLQGPNRARELMRVRALYKFT